MIQPVLAAQKQLQQYLGLSTTDLAQVTPQGQALSVLLQWYLDRTAWEIVRILDVDMSFQQTFSEGFLGNDLNYHVCKSPPGVVTGLSSWDTSSPSTAATTYTVAGLVYTALTYNGFRNTVFLQGKVFQSGLLWLLTYTGAGPSANEYNVDDTTSAWPNEVIQVQLEMIACRLRESGIGLTSLGTVGAIQNGKVVSYVDMWKPWLLRLRPYRKMSI